MGYTLTIGNAYLQYDKAERSLTVECRNETLDNAPAFGEPTDGTNSRWPSYTSWADFSRFVGLYGLFFDKNNPECEILIDHHPGFVALSETHKEIIDEAYAAYYLKYPNAKPGFKPDGFIGTWPDENAHAARLEWLKFWVDWALVNCEMPIFYNS